MSTPAAMPRKAHIVPPKQEEKEPSQRKPRPKPPKKTNAVNIFTKSNGAAADVRINGRPIADKIIDQVDIELNSDGTGVVWVGIIADQISISPQLERKR